VELQFAKLVRFQGYVVLFILNDTEKSTIIRLFNSLQTSQAKPSQAKVLTEGGDLREA